MQTMKSLIVGLSFCLFIFGCGDDDAPQCIDCSQDGGNIDANVADAKAQDATSVVDAKTDAAVQIPVLSGVVSSDWLSDNLANVTLLDIRSASAFATGHIEGAVSFDQNDLRRTVDGISGQVIAEAAATQLFREAGVERGKAVVVYDAGISTAAARVVWTLRYYGQMNAYLLDGGIATWSGARVSDASTSVRGEFVAEKQRGLIVDGAWINERLDGTIQIIDARTSQEYVGGHIPGAVHVDWQRNVGGDGSFLNSESLTALYPGLDKSKKTVVYCASGSRASVSFVVLAGLGFDVALFDGSWKEWSAGAFPIETGE